MANHSKQLQEQTQEQRQSLSHLQVQFVRLLELPTEGLEERVRAEVQENPALEVVSESDEDLHRNDEGNDSFGRETNTTDDDTYSYELDENDLAALGDYRTVDDIPDYAVRDLPSSAQSPTEEIPFSAAVSFYEVMKEQLGEHSLTPEQYSVAEYLIGSLDDDGLLRKSLTNIADELAIYQGIYISVEEVEKVLQIIQKFDPAGIGARSLQECLWLQLRRKPDNAVNQWAIQVIQKHYEDFSHKRWERISNQLNLNREEMEQVVALLTHLNPRPGSSLSETVGNGMQQIIPDFIIHVDENENVTFSLNDSNVPDLRLSKSFTRMIEHYSATGNESRESREALMFLRQKIDAAQSFIDIIERRKQTLILTMQAVVTQQKNFFLEGDEQLLRPLLMKDVAAQTGLNISTVSRVSNSKYVETRFGIFPLKFFFGDSYRKSAFAPKKEENTSQAKGEEPSIRQIKAIIQECIEQEEKERPMTDEQLMELLKEKGFDMARRTVAKYRQQLGIPIARMRH